MWICLLLFLGLDNVISAGLQEHDDSSRKILGSSVVTSVSVIMDTGNGTKATFSDAVGKPVMKPQISKLASPIELLNPDRYEFYTFDDSGDLIKRLMTMEEIKAIIATSGDDVFNIDNISDIIPEKRVNDIVTNVQNVLKEEMESHKMPDTNQLFDTPDVSDSWSMILPAIFGNSGEEIKAEKTVVGTTPETIVIGSTQNEATTKRLISSTASTTTTRPTTGVPAITTTEFNPVSRFTNYFLQSSNTAGTVITTSRPMTRIPAFSNFTKMPSTTHRYTTNKVVILKTTPESTKSTQNPLKLPTESTTLRVQIFPNSNTNFLEEPYNKLPTRGTTPDSNHINIRTPKPQLPLESRVSSTILEHTSPSTYWKSTTRPTHKTSTTEIITPKLEMTSQSTYRSTSKASISTRSTLEYTKTTEEPYKFNNKIQLHSSPITGSPLTTFEEEMKIRTPKPDNYWSTLLSGSTLENTSATSSKPTEKIYILIRPLESQSLSTKYQPVTFTTERVRDKPSSTLSSTRRSTTSSSSPSLSTSTPPRTIFTTISGNHKPTIFSIASRLQTESTPSIKVKPSTPPTTLGVPITYSSKSDELNKINSSTTNQLPDYFTTFVPLPSFTKSPSVSSNSQLTLGENVKNATLPTLAEILNNNTFPDAEISSSSTEYLYLPTSSSYVKPETTDISLLRSSTISELQNLGSISGNKYTSMKTQIPDISATLTTEYATEVPETEISFTDKTMETENSQTTETMNPYSIANKDLLEKLLLSSTNVYDINSAVNQKLTYSVESTSFSEEPTTEVVTPKIDNADGGNQTLIESFGQLLAQAVGNINEVIIKENKTNLKLSTASVPTTDFSTIFITESSEPSTSFPEITTKYDSDNETPTSTSKLEYTEIKTEPTLVTEENIAADNIPLLNRYDGSEEAHIINVTILRKHNATKPAKADLSLEVDYDLFTHNHTEMQKITQTPEVSTPSSDLKYLSESTTSSEDGMLPGDNESTTFLFVNKSVNTPQQNYYTSTLSDETSQTTDESTTMASIQNNTSTKDSSTTESTATSIVTSPTPDQTEDSWTLVSTIAPHSKLPALDRKPTLAPILEPTPTVDLDVKPMQGFGLEESTAKIDADVYQFVQLCNELAFGFWKSVTTGISTARSVIVSPFAATSLLAMVFLGARGATSGEMNEILKLDNMVTFNPHLIFKTVTESILTGPDFGVATSAIVRQLYSDKSRESILNFYKERARFFYDGHVEEVSFKDVGDTIRRRTNLLVKKQTNGKVQDFLKDGSVRVRSPLAAVSASVMQTDCTKGSISERDGEIHFVVFPSIKQRRLIPIPAVVYRSGFLAGYEPSLDATAVALGDKDDVISYIFVLPGRQGINALGDGLSRLEKRLVESSFQKGAWGRLLRTLIPRPGLEVQIPRFSHRSIINATSALKQMGLKTLFDVNKADLRGLNGVADDLHLSDMLQFNYFSVCGNANAADTHHSEYYPATARRSLRKHRRLDHFEQQRILHDDPLYIIDYLSLPLNLRPRQARVPQVPRLRLDRPFLYFVRHNPTGLILHMGRFNPRLLP